MKRKYLKLILDVGCWILATPLAYLIKIDLKFISYVGEIVILTAILFPLKFLLIYSSNIFRQSWHNVGIKDLLKLIQFISGFTVGYFIASFFLQEYIYLPKSVPLIEGMLTLLGLGNFRLLTRLIHENRKKRKTKNQEKAKRVLIIGAGEAGTMVAREMIRHPESGMKPVGFLDDDPVKQTQDFLGLPVLGTTSDLSLVVRKHDIDQALIAMPSASGEIIRKIVRLSNETDVEYKILPALHELLSGKVSISQIRNVDLNDLLRRDPVNLDIDEIAKFLNGKTILVTGAGGSIGSEIVRQILNYDPGNILLIGRGENSIYLIDRELRTHHKNIVHIPLIGDVRDRTTLSRIFEEHQPEVVFHAAAHKHVPLMEENPRQAVYNNVFGTKNLVDLSLEHGIEKFVNISTDKAVNPTSIMGATKRLAEHIVEWGASVSETGHSFVSVRFGNVLGSRGSVIPLFKQQIKKGGPITVTDPDMTRYFMTIPEAAQLVLQAGCQKENGVIYVLDMGEPIKIKDMAEDLIRLSGFEPGKEIDIVYTGKRPGEKLSEELLTAEEGTTATQHSKIFKANKNSLDVDNFEEVLDDLHETVEVGSEECLRTKIEELIPSSNIEIADNEGVMS